MPTRREKANAIRALSMDAVQRANSGHPGMPMGMADIAEVLWGDILRHNPNNPSWFNRDRFVLSNGHGSMLLYSLLHLTGYDLSIDDLKAFRQLHSKTPGHPEYGLTPGVETTTGPLGQGLATAVGMALAEKILAARYNRDEHEVIDHHTYVFVGDGCLMEGISHEACSLAGTLGLGKLVVLFDDNGISIDGEVKGWFTDDTPGRFAAYGWHVVPDVDGHDPEALQKAILAAKENTTQPSLICCKTVIGFGAPKLAGTAKTHGSPLGDEEIQGTREKLGWEHAPFVIPADIQEAWDRRAAGEAWEQEWKEAFARYEAAHPALAAELSRRIEGALPEGWEEQAQKSIAAFQAAGEKAATRKASLLALNAFGPSLPELIGGSADLSGSNKTIWSGSKTITREAPDGNYIYFGVREFAMSAMVNGFALHGGFVPYAGTFLVFSDYARNAVRLAALMRIPSIFVYSHDSIGLGEDGPTHQPVEHLASLQIIPNLSMWRPCDTTETAVAWKAAIETRDGPTGLVLTRQGTPPQARDAEALENIARGGYILHEPQGAPQALLLASGSEVGLAMDAAKALAEKGVHARVVSMPCLRRFDAQDAAYRDAVLPADITARLSIEAGVGVMWHKYLGGSGRTLSLESFGESAPAKELFAHFGFTVERIVQEVQEMLA